MPRKRLVQLHDTFHKVDTSNSALSKYLCIVSGGKSDLGAGTGHHSKPNYSNGFASQLGNSVAGRVMLCLFPGIVSIHR